MTIHTDFNEKECYKVARLSGVKQTEVDVRYARRVNYYTPDKLYCLRSETFFLIGVLSSQSLRIIGIAVAKEHQRKGWGSRLLAKAIQDAKMGGVKIITTRTKSGADFYAKKGFDVVGMVGDDYKMQLELK